MEEIDLKELLTYFVNKIWIIIISTLTFCIIGALYGMFFQKPLYQSETTVILVANESSKFNSLTQNDVVINKDLVNTYAEIIKSRRVLDQVIEKLNLDSDYKKLSKKIGVSAINDTEIIKITVTDLSRKDAMNIANVTANYFSKEVVNLYNINNVNILDKAVEAENPYNVNIVKQLVLSIFVGVVSGAAIVFTIFYFDRTIKNVQQIEKKLKLPILGSVQMYFRR